MAGRSEFHEYFGGVEEQVGGNRSSTDICPCCRSFRGEFCNERSRKFKIQSSQEEQQPENPKIFSSKSTSCSSSSCSSLTSSSSSFSCNQHHSCCSSLSSPNTHHHLQQHLKNNKSYNRHSSANTKNSQLVEKCSRSTSFLSSISSSLLSVRHFNNLCWCAKNVNKINQSSSFSSSTSKTTTATSSTFFSTVDGWKAFGLIVIGILVILPTSTMSSPVNIRSQSRSPSPSGHHSHHSSPHRNDKPMKWINPCRIPKSLPTSPAEIQMPSQSDEEIFQNIVTQAKKAEVQARQFFADFREECFGDVGHDYQQLHYDWLKDVADKVDKNLGEPVSQSRLESLEVEDILKSMYRGLQKLAVGLEQVVLDQAFHGGSFYQHFHEAEFQLKYVLCEFQIAMMEKNIQYEDVTRDIMDRQFYVNLEDKSMRNLRDFSIFRDYLNTLEFIKESFEHFWKVTKESS